MISAQRENLEAVAKTRTLKIKLQELNLFHANLQSLAKQSIFMQGMMFSALLVGGPLLHVYVGTLSCVYTCI